MSEITSLWIFGPACAGKTTLARLMVEKLRSHGQPAVLCDGDEVRDLFDVKLGYDPASRSRQTKRVLGLAKWVLRQGMMPVVAIIHPFETDRMECRKDLPGYTEVYLRCDIKERIRRDGKKLYLPAMRGEKKNVVGIDIPFDEPAHADLILDSDRQTPEELSTAILSLLKLKPGASREIG